jgi:hypothetical protein
MPKSCLIPLCCALVASTCLNASAQAQPAAQPQPQADQVQDAPSPAWLIAGITLGVAGLALDIDSARRFDQGEKGCFPVLEFGGCYVEALAATPIGMLGGLSTIFYGKWLGEHDASAALARGQPLVNHDSLERWALAGVLGGFAISTAVNVYGVVRVLSDYDKLACEEASKAERAEACGGGSMLGLAIVQSAALAVALVSAGPLGYAVGYDSVRSEHEKSRARTAFVPWARRGAFGFALGLSL